MNENQSLVRSSNSAPTAADPETAKRLRSARSLVGGTHHGRIVWHGNQPIGPNTRQMLTDRLAFLDASFKQRDRHALERALVKMFSGMKTIHEGAENAVNILRDYADVLEDQPVWAVVEACEKVKRGKGPSLIFAPTTAQLCRLAENVAEPFARERREILEVLQARTFDEIEAAIAEEAEQEGAERREGLRRLRADEVLSEAERARAAANAGDRGGATA